MEATENYLERLDTYLVDNQDYIFRTDGTSRLLYQQAITYSNKVGKWYDGFK